MASGYAIRNDGVFGFRAVDSEADVGLNEMFSEVAPDIPIPDSTQDSRLDSLMSKLRNSPEMVAAIEGVFGL
jgi:hypothetical protein